MVFVFVPAFTLTAIAGVALWCLTSVSTPYDEYVDDEEQMKFLEDKL